MKTMTLKTLESKIKRLHEMTAGKGPTWANFTGGVGTLADLIVKRLTKQKAAQA